MPRFMRLLAPMLRVLTGRGLFALLFVFSLPLAAAPGARAQAGLEVYAIDVEAGAPVGEARVHVVNDAIGYESARVTNQNGKAQWPGLSTSGRYDVYVEETDRYYEARVTGVGLRANFTRSVTLLLTPIETVELDEVVVEGRTGGIAEVNKTNAEVSSSLSAQSLEELPVEGRNFTQSLYRLPNVTPSTGFFPEAPNVSINGANGLYTNYLIDGMDNNEQFLGGPQFEVPTGMVKDVTVLTSTYSAEYGRTGNGIFNVTTKSGSNQVEGEVFYLTRPGQPLDANSSFAQRDLSGNAVKNGFERHQGGVAIGGPIVKDRTFYFVNVEHTTDWKDNVLRVPELGLTESVPGQNHYTYASGKIDHRWTDALRSTLRANLSRQVIDEVRGGLRHAPAAAGGAEAATLAGEGHHELVAAARALQLDEAVLEEAAAQVAELAGLLHACVQAGASINFVLPFSEDEATAFWRAQVLPPLRAGERVAWTVWRSVLITSSTR